MGRYITSDPIGLEGGLNTFGYVYQNAVKYADVQGLQVTINIVNTGSTANSISGTITTTSDLVPNTASSNQIQDSKAGSCECKPPLADGSYPAHVRTDGGKTRIELTGTASQGLTNIQIHIGNAPNVNGKEVLNGCIAPGTAGGLPDWVSNSERALSAIMGVINADGSGKITVNVTTQNSGTNP